MILKLTFLTLFFLSLPLAAQVDTPVGGWSWLAIEGELGESGELERLKELKDFRYAIDFHFRTKDASFSQAIVRPYLGYSLSKGVDVWVGYAYVPFDKKGTIQHEHRLIQMLTYKSQLGESKTTLFVAKTKLEERFLHDQQEMAIRIRQLAKLSIPLPFVPKEKGFKVFFSDEVLVNANSTGIKGAAGKFENRMSLGLSYRLKLFKNPANISVAYLNRHNFQDYSNHVISIGLVISVN